jgi:hypothetical protein
MVAAALGHFIPQQGQCVRRLRQEVLRRFDEEAARMTVPLSLDSIVDGRRFFDGLDTQWVLPVVRGGRCRGPQVNHRVVPRQFECRRRANGREKVARSCPIGRAIDRAPVAEQDRSVPALGRRLELALHVENRTLRRLMQLGRDTAGETSSKDNARGLRKRFDMDAEEQPDKFQHGSLSGPWSSGENHAAGCVLQLTITGLHDGGSASPFRPSFLL